MGSDKALVKLNGQPLLLHALRTLREAGLTASIAGGRPALAAYAPLIEDTREGHGPLSGICSALASTHVEWSVFISVDLPLLPASLLVYLLHHASITGRVVTVPAVNGFIQTFPVILHRSALPTLESELEAGRSGCFSAFKAAASTPALLSKEHFSGVEGPASLLSILPVESLLQCGQLTHPAALPPSRWFLNVNTPQNLLRAAVHSRISIA
jgi:molybdopterin-guanine dinucleotide biosynthesis protein A